jgi:hypothetical protein
LLLPIVILMRQKIPVDGGPQHNLVEAALSRFMKEQTNHRTKVKSPGFVVRFADKKTTPPMLLKTVISSFTGKDLSFSRHLLLVMRSRSISPCAKTTTLPCC